MKKHTFKKQSFSSLNKRALWIAVFILTALQVVSFVYIIKIGNHISDDSKKSMTSFINSTEEKRYKYPVIDISENRIYIPEARIYLPLNDISRDIRYNFFNMKDHEALYFSLPAAIGRQTEYDDPGCDKVVALTQSKEIVSGNIFVDEVQPTKYGLKYISRHNACQIYPDSLSSNLAEIVKQLQQY